MSEFRPPTTPTIPSSQHNSKEGVASEPSESFTSGTAVLPVGACSTVPLWRASLVVVGLSLQFACSEHKRDQRLHWLHLAIFAFYRTRDKLFSERDFTGIGMLSHAFHSNGSSVWSLLSFSLFDCSLHSWCLAIYICYRSVLLARNRCYWLFYGSHQFSNVDYTEMQHSSLLFVPCKASGPQARSPSSFQMHHQVFPVVPGSTARDVVFAVYTSGFTWGGANGIVIGGLFTQYSAIQWRGIFAMLACLSTASWVCILVFAPPSIVKPVPGGIDYMDGFLISVAFTLTLFSISHGSHIGWETSYVMSFPIFYAWEVYIETKGRTPMFRMSNFTRGRCALVSLLCLIGFVPFIIWEVLTGAAGYSAVQVMLRFLPPFAALSSPSIATYALRRVSTQIVFITGGVLVLCSNVIFAVAPQDAYWNHGQFLAPGAGKFGVTLIYMSGVLYLVSCVPPDQAAASGSWYAVTYSFSASLGNIIAFVVIADYPTTQPNIWANGYWTGVAWAAFIILAAIPAFWGIGTLGKSGETSKARVQAEMVVQDERNPA